MRILLGLLCLAALCLAGPLEPRRLPVSHDNKAHSLSAPGFTFRRATPLRSSVPTTRKIRKATMLKQVLAPHSSKKSSTLSRLGGVQKSNGGTGYENVTAIGPYAAEYAVRVELDGVPLLLTLDSGSADTWVRGRNFTCLDSVNSSQPVETCGFGPPWTADFRDGPIQDQHFVVTYSDGEHVAGPLGLVDVGFGGLTVSEQTVAVATQGYWYGNNITSGVIGMAYPALTNAYYGDDLSDDSQYSSLSYSPVFTSMVINGLIEPYWSLAMNRNSSDGLVAVGGLPPVDLSRSYYAQTPILITDLSNRDMSSWQPSFYTIVPDGFEYGRAKTSGRYPFIIDTGTTLIYVPPDLAQAINDQFNPPATYLWYYGSYFTACDAIPPRFGVAIAGSTYYINPRDMIDRTAIDPFTGMCQTAIGSGGTGPYILGIKFLVNVVAVFNVGMGTMEFFSRQFY